MPEPQRRSDPVPLPSEQEQHIDRMLLSSILLCPVAVGINTVVGFTVAHWTVAVNRKSSSYLVSIVDLALCAAAGLLAWRANAQLAAADDSIPELGRRKFMAGMGLALSCFSAIVVVAATLAVVILRPSD
jgi:hypothetical protein